MYTRFSSALVPQPNPLPPALSPTATRGIADSVRTLTELASDPQTSGLDFLGALKERLFNPSLWIGMAVFLVKAVIIVLIAQAILRLISRAAKAYTARFNDLPPTHGRRQRAQTLAALVVSMSRYVIWPVALVTILDSAGFSVTSLLATAGIAGLAVGFGAQTLVRDVISGFFLLFDDTISVGDTVRIGTDEGTVEFIGVRMIKVRKFNGELLMVPSGELRIFGNRSIEFARIVVNVNIPLTTPTEPVLEAMHRVADAWANAHRAILLDAAPDVQAVTGFGDTFATLRIVAKVQVGEQYAAERDLRRRLLEAFAASGYDLNTGKTALVVHGSTAAVPPPVPKADPGGASPKTPPAADDAALSDA